MEYTTGDAAAARSNGYIIILYMIICGHRLFRAEHHIVSARIYEFTSVMSLTVMTADRSLHYVLLFIARASV